MTDESDRGPDEGGSDGDDEIVRSQYDWASTAPSMAVVETLAVALGREETTFEPLFDSIDPDALNAFFRPSAATASANVTGSSLSFTVDGRRVTVRGAGSVVVRSISDNE